MNLTGNKKCLKHFYKKCLKNFYKDYLGNKLKKKNNN